jgi:hypothetical protein
MDGHKYSCERCQYFTNIKDYFKKHNLSKKHLNIATGDVYKYECSTCSKKYKNQSGLWHHHKKCINAVVISKAEAENSLILLPQSTELNKIYDDLKNSNEELKSSNTELKNMFKEFLQTTETNNNEIKNEIKNMFSKLLDSQQPTTITNNTIHNNNFNINLFLKEECNEALNMDHFAKNIMYEFGNVQEMLTDYVKGSISILKKNWEQIPLNKRPMHYLEGEDPHQQIFHIRHNNEWKIETELNWLKQINADDDDVLEKETLYFALKQLDKGKIIHLGYVHNCNEIYKNNHNRITREVTRVDYKMKLYDEVIKMITLDPNNISNPGRIVQR